MLTKQPRNGRSRSATNQQQERPILVVPCNLPGQISPVRSQSRSIRLQATAAQADFDITVRMLASFLSMATSSTVAYPLPYSVRVKKVKMWAWSSVLGSSATIALEWNTSSTFTVSNNMSVQNTTFSTTEPAWLVSTPPKNSLCSWWLGTAFGTQVAFSISCPQGTVIEIDYDYTLDATEPANSPIAITGGTVGTLFAQNPSATLSVPAPWNSYF